MPAMRKSAEVRREEILAIALRHFAIGGFHGTSTEVIAKEADISQPYLFRLFRTKRELFLACGDRACERVLDVFGRAAAAAPAGEKLQAMGQAYVKELLPDKHAILMLMQGYAAAADPDEVWRFFATGMLLNIVAALELEQSDHPIFRAWSALHA